MEMFKINSKINFVNHASSTRNGFKHESTLFKEGKKVGFGKVNYLNRTWETYDFQTSMIKAVEKSSLSPKEKMSIIKNLKSRKW